MFRFWSGSDLELDVKFDLELDIKFHRMGIMYSTVNKPKSHLTTRILGMDRIIHGKLT